MFLHLPFLDLTGISGKLLIALHHHSTTLFMQRNLLLCRWLTALLYSLYAVAPLRAEPVAVRYPEGSVHGFLALRTLKGEVLAAGDLTQVVHGEQLVSHLVFRFKDGSVDEETAVFTQKKNFLLISDHHIQKGKMFPEPLNLLINRITGQVTVHYLDKGHEKVETTHLDLPNDLANGVILDILKNISPEAKETKLSYVAAAPKPRLVHLSITSQGEDGFSIADVHDKAMRFQVKVELGGIDGIVAPLIGKQPADTKLWVAGGEVPAFVKWEGPLYLNGPIWRVEMTSPVWPGAPASNR